MNKKVIILILSLLLISCTHFNDTSKKESSENLFGYSLDNNKRYTKTDEIYTNRKSLNFQNNVKSADDSPYTKDELNNLDYNKEISLSQLNFRIPSRAAIFKDDKRWYIDFPIASDYKILIEFSTISYDDYDDNKDLEENLLNTADDLVKKYSDSQKLISPPLLNKSSTSPSVYFITEGNRYTYTHFLVGGPTNIIHFIIYEDKTLSNASDNIMADILRTIFVQGEDPEEVIKDFNDHKDDLSIYATKNFEISDIKMKLPENLTLLQNRDDLKAYIVRYNNIVIQEVIIRSVPKEDLTIEDAFNENSGNFIYPAEIITKDVLTNGKINDYNYIRTKARIYMNDYTLEGDKITIETPKNYITLLIFGPLSNRNSTNIMSTNIINSIK